MLMGKGVEKETERWGDVDFKLARMTHPIT